MRHVDILNYFKAVGGNVDSLSSVGNVEACENNVVLKLIIEMWAAEKKGEKRGEITNLFITFACDCSFSANIDELSFSLVCYVIRLQQFSRVMSYRPPL